MELDIRQSELTRARPELKNRIGYECDHLETYDGRNLNQNLKINGNPLISLGFVDLMDFVSFIELPPTLETNEA